MARDLLDITDLSTEELATILELAQRPVEQLGRPLAGQGAALIFEKPSNRTRHSMEIAVVQLGGHPVYTRGEEVGFDVREPVEDIGRILEGYHALIAARVFDHSVVERLAAAVDIPVVNMLSDRSHPLQALADVLTMQQLLGDLAGRTVAWVGDYNNVARSLGEVCALSAMHLRFACPPGYDADDAELERLALPRRPIRGAVPARCGGGRRSRCGAHRHLGVDGPGDRQAGADTAFESFTVDGTAMSKAAPGAIFMHCLPAYRGLEVTAEVIDGPQSAVFQQGHNRLHAARGALAFLVGGWV